MIKHVGKHEQKKVVILFKQVPSEDHMCLLVYPDVLPRLYHDSVMKCVESAVGQNANDVGEPLGRAMMDDGRMTLQSLHKEGFIRKVQTNQVIMTPAAGSTVRLDELNKILAEMALGSDAKQRLEELDGQSGIYDPANAPMIEPELVETEMPVLGEGVLSDDSIARDQLAQAERMQIEAAALIAESKNLTKEAYKLVPALKPKRIVKNAAVKKPAVKKAVRKAGRPKKQA